VTSKNPRRQRENRTIAVMIGMYCRGIHRRQSLCADCRDLLAYAAARLEACPFQEGKTTCVKCPVHCYQPAMRTRVREVMRYAGPRMLLRHPWLTFWHLRDGRRREPVRPERE